MSWRPHLCGWAPGSFRANSSLWLIVPECLCPSGYNQILIVPMGATSIRIEEAAASRNFLGEDSFGVRGGAVAVAGGGSSLAADWVLPTQVKSIRGEYYLNGHWTIEGARALPVASTLLHYDGELKGPGARRLNARGPTSEPLVIEVKGRRAPDPQEAGRRVSRVAWLPASNGDPPAQLISQRPNPGVRRVPPAPGCPPG